MKVVFIKRKTLLNFSLLLIILVSIICFRIATYKHKHIETFNPIDLNTETIIDLTGDGSKDKLKIISTNSSLDVEITSNNKTYNLSSLCKEHTLLSNCSYWPAKVYIKNLSKNKIPQIIVQGVKNSSPIQYVFSWDNDKFSLLFSSDKNILGVLDSTSNSTPQCYSINSSTGTQSLSSFMIISKEVIDITKDCKTVPNISALLTLTDIIQKNYEIDEVPDIFKENIPSEELAILWNLDKEHNTYSFEDAFFYDDSIDNEGNITSMKWILTFEKYINQKDDTSKSALVFHVTTERTTDNQYKISSISVK